MVPFVWDGSGKADTWMELELTSGLWFDALLHTDVAKSWLEDQSEKKNLLLSFYLRFQLRVFKMIYELCLFVF